MARFIFFLLLVANAGFGVHIWMALEAERAPKPTNEINPQALKVIEAVDPRQAARQVAETRALQEKLAQAQCIELGGLGAAGSGRLRDMLAALELGNRLSELKIEEITRFGVIIGGFADKKAVDTAVASLKSKNVADYQVLGDNTISLGVFATEEAANRHLAEMVKKGVKGAAISPRNRELRDVVFVISKPDMDVAGKLITVSRDLVGTRMSAVACPASPPPATS